MPVPILCPFCGASGSAPDHSRGHHCRCPKCGNRFKVPELVAPEIKPVSTPPSIRQSVIEKPFDFERQEAVRVRPSDSEGPSQTNYCPFCGERILARAKKCKHCGEMLDPVLRASEEAKRSMENLHSYEPERRTDAPGVISLILGCIALVCAFLGCFTYGITCLVGFVFAIIGAVFGLGGRGHLKVAGLVLNLSVLLLAFVAGIIALIAISALGTS